MKNILLATLILLIMINIIVYIQQILGLKSNKQIFIQNLDVSLNVKAITDFEKENINKKRDLIEKTYPEFENFENQKSSTNQFVKIGVDENDYYFAYTTNDDKLSIPKEATCFRVDNGLRVYKIGEFPNPIDSYSGYKNISLTTCRGIK